jgi:hypothetical protein
MCLRVGDEVDETIHQPARLFADWILPPCLRLHWATPRKWTFRRPRHRRPNKSSEPIADFSVGLSVA